jgi:hypothetical protein
MRRDLFAQVAQAQHHAPDAVAPQQHKLVIDKRPPGHFH